VSTFLVATEKLDHEAADGIDGKESREGGAVTTTAHERHRGRGGADQSERNLVELGWMYRKARRAGWNKAVPSVVERRKAAGRKTHGPRQSSGQTVVAPSDETSGAHECKA
jgi:hypothetical protein